MIRLIVLDYLSSLNEKDELDYIFPFLLDQLKFKIVKTVSASKGQSQYGIDIMAEKVDKDGVKKLFIFQLKGGEDKDIDSHIFYKKDGIYESLMQIKHSNFIDSILEIKDLPRKIIIVHNGELKSNFEITYNGCIKKEFISEGWEVERWDINELKSLFSKYLLNEYIFVKPEFLSLLKKSLAFIDVPENDFKYFKELVDKILNSYKVYNPKNIRRLISTLCMISALVLHYSKEIDNLWPAKECVTYALLKTWGWLLEKNAISSRKIAIKEFLKLYNLHLRILNLYFCKTIPIAKEKDGLFSEKGAVFEQIGYPVRSLEYISYLIYYYQAFVNLNSQSERSIFKNLLVTIEKIINNNSGCQRPLLDNHSIPILIILLFLLENDETEFVNKYLENVLDNIFLIKKMRKRLPELSNNLDSLIEYCSTGARPKNYVDTSSYLINILFEFAYKLKNKKIFNNYWKHLTRDINLLTYYPPENIEENECLLFKKQLTEGNSKLFDSNNIVKDEETAFSYYEKIFNDNSNNERFNFKTDEFGFKHLRMLAHIYFKTPLFPQEWRFLNKR